MIAAANIIIPTWNGEEHIRSCLRAVTNQSYKPLRIIVIDNGSTDKTREIVKESFPGVHLIKNQSNLGFSVACNLAIRETNEGPIILLNQDTIVDEDWLNQLLAAFETDSTIGIVGSVTRFPGGEIQHAGGILDERGNGSHKRKEIVVQQPVDSEYVTGAALAIHRNTLESIGYLDERFYPAYFEDVDICLRARQAGFRVVVAPTAKALHKEESKMIDHTFESDFYFHKNRMQLVIKHWSLSRFNQSFLVNESNWMQNIGEGGEILVSAVHHAYFELILNLSELMETRATLYGYPSSDQTDIIKGLLKLRGVVPLGPARIEITDSQLM